MKSIVKISILIAFCLLLMGQSTSAIKFTKLDISHYINTKSILNNYQEKNCAIDKNALVIFFVNIFTDQIMGASFSKRWPALNEKQLTKRLHNSVKGNLKNIFKNYEIKIIDLKTFEEHSQLIPYFRIHIYQNNKLKFKGLYGIIRDYDNKHIIIYSFGPPSTFSEEAFIKFFSEIEFKTDNFV